MLLRVASSLSNFELNLRAGIKCACACACEGKKRIRIRRKVCYDFSHRHSSAPLRAPSSPRSYSLSLSSCCCTFPFPHAPKSTQNFLLSTHKKAATATATKHTQNFCHMRRKHKQRAACGMGHGGSHRMQASATGGNKARHCDEVGHDKFYDLLRNSNTKLNLMCARNILVRDSLPPPPLLPLVLWQYAKYTQSVDNSKNTDTHKTQAEETA